MINPAKTSVIVIAHPDLCMAPDLTLWLEDMGFPRKNVLPIRGRKRDNICVYNYAVELALTRRTEYHLFVDKDIRPYEGTVPLLSAPFDFTCAMAETEAGCASWSRPDSFHAGMWLARSSALRRIAPPWFMWKYNATGSDVIGCMCAQFRDKAKAAGLTIGHAGHAHHWPRGAELPDAIRLLGSAEIALHRKELSATKEPQ